MDQELLTLLDSLPDYCKSLGAKPCVTIVKPGFSITPIRLGSPVPMTISPAIPVKRQPESMR